MKFCEECGAQLEDDALFCEECGASVEASPQTKSDKTTSDTKKIVVVILAVFVLLGGFGGAYAAGLFDNLGTSKTTSSQKAPKEETKTLVGNTKEKTTEEVTPTPSPTPEITATPDITATPRPTLSPVEKWEGTYYSTDSNNEDGYIIIRDVSEDTFYYEIDSYATGEGNFGEKDYTGNTAYVYIDGFTYLLKHKGTTMYMLQYDPDTESFNKVFCKYEKGN